MNDSVNDKLLDLYREMVDPMERLIDDDYDDLFAIVKVYVNAFRIMHDEKYPEIAEATRLENEEIIERLKFHFPNAEIVEVRDQEKRKE